MSRPQQPEIARSGRTDVDPEHAAESLEGRRTPRHKGRTGPVPPENQPGHHPSDEQDKPDLDAFAEKFAADGAAATEAGSAEVETAAAAEDRPTGSGAGARPEPPYVRYALYPVRLAVHAATWSRDYFRRR